MKREYRWRILYCGEEVDVSPHTTQRAALASVLDPSCWSVEPYNSETKKTAPPAPISFRQVLCPSCKYTCPRCGEEKWGTAWLGAVLGVIVVGSLIWSLAPTIGLHPYYFPSLGIALLTYELLTWVKT